MINYKDVAVAFASSGDTITWKYSEDVRITIYYENGPIYEYCQGKSYVPGSNMRSYKNSWPVVLIPPRHRYFYSELDSHYWHHFSKHPNAECQNTEAQFCPVCSERKANHQITLYLLCILMVPRILYIPHFRH